MSPPSGRTVLDSVVDMNAFVIRFLKSHKRIIISLTLSFTIGEFLSDI